MKFTPQSILDIILIEPTVHGDFRGYFAETFRQDLFENTLNQKVTFVQDNESKSSMGIVRGLHYQLPPFSQSKLVRVTEGKILDVVLERVVILLDNIFQLHSQLKICITCIFHVVLLMGLLY